MAVAEKALKGAKLAARGVTCTAGTADPARKQRTAVIPYIHQLSHNLKRIAMRTGGNVAFSAPDKLSKLCRKINCGPKKKSDCRTRHGTMFVDCIEGVVYKIPLFSKKYTSAKPADALPTGYANIEITSGTLTMGI